MSWSSLPTLHQYSHKFVQRLTLTAHGLLAGEGEREGGGGGGGREWEGRREGGGGGRKGGGGMEGGRGGGREEEGEMSETTITKHITSDSCNIFPPCLTIPSLFPSLHPTLPSLILPFSLFLLLLPSTRSLSLGQHCLKHPQHSDQPPLDSSAALPPPCPPCPLPPPPPPLSHLPLTHRQVWYACLMLHV